MCKILRRPGRASPSDLARALCLCVGFLCGAMPAAAASDPSRICEDAAARASAATGVPVDVLNAISVTETGTKRGGRTQPWPWTVNMEGKGVWFDSEPEALDYARTNFDRGARSFDVGCFQLNYKWHGKAFRSIEHMFDPTANALYAAAFLGELYAETGNWADAAGAYHSRTPQYANRYKARFSRILAGLAGEVPASPQLPVADPQPRQIADNRFPLLIGGASAQSNLGSLFPAATAYGGSRLIGG